MKMATLNVTLVNHSGTHNSYAYITGQAIDNNNSLVLLQSDGKTAYYPTSPSTTISPLAQDCAIPLGPPGSSRTVTIPHIAGGRLWFVREGTLTFYLNPGPALVEPSSSNPSDPNYNLFWDFCEFTWNSTQLYVNITYVDFVSLPIAIALTTTSGETRTVEGLPRHGLNTICNALKEQNAKDNAGWDKLIVTNNGANLRAVSPNTGIILNPGLFGTYYNPYVEEVWSKYTDNTLTVDTQAAAGGVTAKVLNGQLTFANNVSYAQPSTADIFSNSSGPFAVSGDPTKDAITARLAAAFNRSTLLLDAVQPDNEQVKNYYQNPVTNHYAKICHETTLGGSGYAFPYDDVTPSNGADQSGSLFDYSPKLLTVTLGGGPGQTNNPVTRQPGGLVTAAPADSGAGASSGTTAPAAPAQVPRPRRLQGLKNVMRKLTCQK